MFIIYLAVGIVFGLGLAWFVIYMLDVIWEIIRDTITLLFDI